jgi:putative intracellular protease/amidase
MKVLLPLPDSDFCVTESAVPWTVLTRAGHEVVFATEEGLCPAGDQLLLGGLPFGLGAKPDAVACYRDMEAALAGTSVRRWVDIDPTEFDGMFLAGGHAPGMRQYLASELLQKKVAEFWALGRPVGAVCHGVLLLARTVGSDGKPILAGRKTTCLPKYMERTAWWLTAWKLGRYYRTYEAYVEDEVRASGALFERGPISLVKRGTDGDDQPAFVVEDGNYVSARWPGDAWLVGKKFLELLEKKESDHVRESRATTSG